MAQVFFEHGHMMFKDISDGSSDQRCGDAGIEKQEVHTQPPGINQEGLDER